MTEWVIRKSLIVSICWSSKDVAIETEQVHVLKMEEVQLMREVEIERLNGSTG